MNDKILNKYNVESNGETIEVKVIQTDKGIKVNIIGKTQDVFINGEEFYSFYDKEEYKYIPTFLIPFIEKYLTDCGSNDIEVEKGEVKAYLEILGREFLAILPTKRAKKKVMALRDYILEYELIEEDCDIKIENGKENFESFKSSIKDNGCDIVLSHSGDDYDNWYDLVVPIVNEINEEAVLKCIKLWSNYNDSLKNKYLGGRY